MIFEILGGRRRQNKKQTRAGRPDDPSLVDGRAVGAQRFRGAERMLSDGATGPCCYALLLRRAAPPAMIVGPGALCAVSSRESVGQFFAGRVTAGGQV